MPRKQPKATHYEFDGNRIGIDHTFLITILKNGEGFLYRPTQYELFHISKKLHRIKRNSIPAVIEAIEECCLKTSDKILRQNFGEALLQYMQDTKRDGNEPNKPRSYASAVYTAEHYIIPYLHGDVQDITTDDCRRMLAELLHKGYSASTINKAYTFTNEFFTYLKNTGVIQISPMANVKKTSAKTIAAQREKLGKISKERKYITSEEIERIREVAYNGYDYVQTYPSGKTYTTHYNFEQPIVIDILLTTGLRLGELLALKWTDWDPDEQTLTIRSNRSTYAMDGVTITEETSPKNEASASTIRLLDQANEFLTELRKQEPPEYNGHIVHSKKYEPINSRAFTDRLSRICIAAGLYTVETDKNGKEYKKSTVSPHTYRHTFASILWEHTRDIKICQTKLRHSDPGTTLKIYTDIMEERENEVNANITI